MTSYRYGYARVSTTDQDPALQVDALHAAGVDPHRVFVDVASGALATRPQLEQLRSRLRPGDTLVVWRLDRLGRSLTHLVGLITELGEQQIGFVSLTEAIDTTTPAGRLLFEVMASLAQFERDVIRERTIAGLAAAKGPRPRRRPTRHHDPRQTCRRPPTPRRRQTESGRGQDDRGQPPHAVRLVVST